MKNPSVSVHRPLWILSADNHNQCSSSTFYWNKQTREIPGDINALVILFHVKFLVVATYHMQKIPSMILATQYKDIFH